MRHSRFDESVFTISWAVKVLDKFRYEFRNNIGGWAFVNILSLRFISDIDRPWPPVPWMFCKIVAQHHEVEASKETIIESEARVFGELQNVGHSIAIACYCMPRLFPCLKWFVSFGGCYSILGGYQITFNAI